MKKFLSVTFAVAMLAAISFGQAAGPRNGAPGGVQGGRQGQSGQGGVRMMMGGRMSKMQDEILAKLNPPLNKDQKAKIEALRKKQAAEFEKMRGQMGAPGARGGAQGGATGGAKGGTKGGTTNDAGQRTGTPPAGGPSSDMREKFRTMMEKNQKDFMAILTKPQQTQYEKLMKEAIEKMRKERGGGPGAGGKAGGSKSGGGKGDGR